MIVWPEIGVNAENVLVYARNQARDRSLQSQAR